MTRPSPIPMRIVQRTAAPVRWCALTALCVLVAARPVWSQHRHIVAPAVRLPAGQSAWEQAQRARQALEATAEMSRTSQQYDQAMERYRAIYHAHPGDEHAAEAVNAVADLLAEQGRAAHDAKLSKAAIGQYEFLRKQYPGSSLRVAALLSEAQIEENDLHDRGAAAADYRALLEQYPRSEHAEEALAGLESLSRTEPSRAETIHAESLHKDAAAETSFSPTAEPQAKAGRRSGSRSGSRPVPSSESQSVSRSVPQSVSRSAAEAIPSSAAAHGEATSMGTPETSHTPASLPILAAAAPHRNGPLAQITGIRHWSTPDYTRVAIDLESPSGGKSGSAASEVTYEAARVPNPDRIYFDLYGTQLAHDLVGKSFAVTDDGFLKRVRAAQSSADVTRVVLDVNDVTEYSAFLLQNPTRLIIDIHGAARHDQIAAQETKPGRESAAAPSPAVREGHDLSATGQPLVSRGRTTSPNARSQPLADTATLPPMAPTTLASETAQDAPAQRVAITQRPTEQRPVPNAVAVVKPATSVEVADVSQQPGRIDATRRPTAKPISAVVPHTGRTDSVAPADTDAAKRAALPSAASSKRRRRHAPVTAADAAVAGESSAEAAATETAALNESSLAKATRKDRVSTADAAVAGDRIRTPTHTADGETSLVRALGLKIHRIVIDAGHGGHDSGTLGVDGIEEKDVVLDVALRLGKLLHDRLGAEIIYTRADDTFIPLETRTAIANKAQADLFLSIHANSSSDPSARGVETYYLNFTSQPDALDVAARENAVSTQSIHQLSDLVKKIALKEKIEESREFAQDVESSLYAGLAKGNDGLKDRGVKKAPFVVLIGANMPSILAEISFVTNPKDASELSTPAYRERVAESLYRGVARYASGLGSGPVPNIARSHSAGGASSDE
jgi:N-acetylmuramoyl-L-alanine amidase